MTIRKARPADARDLAEVHVASWKEAYRGLVPDGILEALSVDEAESRWRGRLTEGPGEMLVLEEQDGIVGFVAYGPSRDDDAGQGRIGEIYIVYLDPRAWRQGRGTMLCEAAIGALREQGFSEVTLWVLQGNERAKGFYEALGFAADGATRVKTRGDGLEMHLLRLRRALPAGDDDGPA